MSNKYRIAALIACAAASACGDDSGGSNRDDSGTPSGIDAGNRPLDASVGRDGAASDASRTVTDAGGAVADLCSAICARTAAAACPRDNEDAATCVAGCIDSPAGYPVACGSAYLTVLGCASHATFACDTGSGKGQPTGCDLELLAFAACLQAPPDDLDSGAATGLDASTGSTPDAATFGADAGADAARAGGGDAASATDAGDASGSDAGTGDAAAVAISNIPSSCDPSAADGECFICAKANCCGELSACDAMCRAGAACVARCDPNDDVCLQACADAVTDTAVQAFGDLTTCYTGSCLNECGLPK